MDKKLVMNKMNKKMTKPLHSRHLLQSRQHLQPLQPLSFLRRPCGLLPRPSLFAQKPVSVGLFLSMLTLLVPGAVFANSSETITCSRAIHSALAGTRHDQPSAGGSNSSSVLKSGLNSTHNPARKLWIKPPPGAVIEFDPKAAAALTAAMTRPEIVDFESLGEALSKNIILGPHQKDLFDIYKTLYFGDASKDYSKSLDHVYAVWNKLPSAVQEQGKLPLREFIVNAKTKVYEMPKEFVDWTVAFQKTLQQFQEQSFPIKTAKTFKIYQDYWKKVFGFSQSTNAEWLAFLDQALPEANQNYLASSASIADKTLHLYPILKNLRDYLIKQNKSVVDLSQMMINLVFSSGFSQPGVQNKLKSDNPQERLEGLNEGLAEVDALVLQLGYPGHFEEMLSKLHVKAPTGFADQNSILSRYHQFKNLLGDKHYRWQETESFRVRPLSWMESPLRSCLGLDCSTGTYFEKALDPAYLYFTMTERSHQSSGHITVVLGTGEGPDHGAHKIAFVDKVQNIPEERIPWMIEGLRRSLNEQGYLLAFPEDLGENEDGHGGISNSMTTIESLRKTITPHSAMRILNFTPHESGLNFENKYSRAYRQLPLRVLQSLGSTLGEAVQFTPGAIFDAQRAPEELTAKALVARIQALAESREDKDVRQYLRMASGLYELERKGLIPKGQLHEKIIGLINDRGAKFTLRKAAFLESILLGIQKDVDRFTDVSLRLQELFTEGEQKQILSEMYQWIKSTQPKKKAAAQIVFNLFAMRGDVQKLEAMREAHRSGNIRIDFGKAFQGAGGAGNVPALEFLLEKHLAGVITISQWGFDGAFEWAGRGGHVPALKFLLEKHRAGVITISQKVFDEAFYWAGWYGDVPALEFLVEKHRAKVITISQEGFDGAFEGAGDGGHVPALEFLLEMHRAKVITISQEGFDGAFEGAGEKGNLPTLEFLVEKHRAKVMTISQNGFDGAFLLAGRAGDVPALKFLLEMHRAKVIKISQEGFDGAFEGAGYYGHVPALEFFLEKHKAEVITISQKSFDEAFKKARQSHFQAAEFLRKMHIEGLITITELKAQLKGE